MNASHVTQLACWYGVTEYELFRMAYRWKYDTDGYIEPYIVDFSLHDKVPPFVKVFIWTCCYPQLILKGGLYENPLRPYESKSPPRIPKG